MRYAFPLLPPDSNLQAMALFDQAQSVELQYFAEPAGRIAFEKFAKKFIALPCNEQIVMDALKAIESFLDVTEGLLSERKYMVGDEFSLVDIYYVPLIQRLFICGYGYVITSRQAVAAWWERVSTRPAIQNHLAA